MYISKVKIKSNKWMKREEKKNEYKIVMFIILDVLWTAVKSNDNVTIIFYNKPRKKNVS